MKSSVRPIVARYNHHRTLFPSVLAYSLQEKGSPNLLQHPFPEAPFSDEGNCWSKLQHWLEVESMTQRIHPALGYLTPAEFEQALHAETSGCRR